MPFLAVRDKLLPSGCELMCSIDGPDTNAEAARLFTDLPIEWRVSDGLSNPIAGDTSPAMIVIESASVHEAIRVVLRFKPSKPGRYLIFLDPSSPAVCRALGLCLEELLGKEYKTETHSDFVSAARI